MGPLKIIKEVCCWSIAFSCVVLLLLGWYMVGLTFFDRWYHDSLSAHKSLGMILFFLIIARSFWLIFIGRYRKFQAPIPVRSKNYRILFYLVMTVINITGYLISTSAGDSVNIFSLASIPAFVSLKNQALEAAVALHYYLAYGSAVLILVHVVKIHRPRILSRLKSK